MTASLNKVTLIGNIGKDPEVRKMQSGDSVDNFSLATSESWRDKNSGERKEKTEWHNVVIFNDAIAKVAEQYLEKGMKVYIEGALQTRKWTDKQGVDHYSTEIVLQKFRGELVMLSFKEDAGKGKGGGSSQEDYGSQSRAGDRTQSKPKATARHADLDDEIPF